MLITQTSDAVGEADDKLDKLEDEGNEMCALSDWEQEKENCRPLRGGRKGATLAELFSKDSALKKSVGLQSCEGSLGVEVSSLCDVQRRLEMERGEFEARLVTASAAVQAMASESSYEDAEEMELQDDEADMAVAALAQLWLAYARWAADWFPSESKQERAVLERATQQLVEDERCRGLLQHLQLWLRLAEMMREPQDILAFLWSRGIGESHAIFYEAWAASLERQRRFGETEEVLNIGLARNARPRSHLQRLHAEFSLRMQERVQRSAAESQDSLAPDRSIAPQRLALNVLRETEASRMERPVERRGAQAPGLQPPVGMASSIVTSSAEGHSALQCLDETDDGTLPRASVLDSIAGWLIAPVTEAATNKENQRGSAGNLALRARQLRARARRTTEDRPSDLAVFVDPEFDAGSASAGPSASAQAVAVLSTNSTLGQSVIASVHIPAAFAATAPETASQRARRDRTQDTVEATDDIATSLSSLHLRDSPPTKKLCIAANPAQPYANKVSQSCLSRPSALNGGAIARVGKAAAAGSLSAGPFAPPQGASSSLPQPSSSSALRAPAQTSPQQNSTASRAFGLGLGSVERMNRSVLERAPVAMVDLQTPQRRPGSTARVLLFGQTATPPGVSPAPAAPGLSNSRVRTRVSPISDVEEPADASPLASFGAGMATMFGRGSSTMTFFED